MKKHSLFITSLFMLLIMFFFNGKISLAAVTAPAAPTNVAVTTASSNIKLTWAKVTGASGYYVYRSTTSNGNFSLISTVSTNSFTNIGSGTNTTYYYKVMSFVKSGKTKVYGTYSNVVSFIGTPSNFKAAVSSYNSVHLSWNEVSGAAGYEVYSATSQNGAYSLLVDTNSTSYDHSSLKYATTIYYKVRSYVLDGSNHVCSSFTTITSAKPMLAVPKLLTAKVNGDGYIALTWSSVSAASGYDIYRSTSANGTYVQLSATESTTYVDTDASPSITYYYKIKSHLSVGPSYLQSDYTNTISYKFNISAPTGLKATANGRDMSLSWNAINCVTGYELYRSTSASGTYTLVGSPFVNTYLNANLAANKKYYYKVRAFVQVGKTKNYGPYSAVVNQTTGTAQAPNFIIYTDQDTYDDVSYVALAISNNGSKKLTIYYNNAYLADSEDEYYDRDLDLVDEEDNEIDYVDIPANSDAVTIYFDLYDSNSRYNANSTIYFEFSYDGVRYVGRVSNSDGAEYMQK